MKNPRPRRECGKQDNTKNNNNYNNNNKNNNNNVLVLWRLWNKPTALSYPVFLYLNFNYCICVIVRYYRHVKYDNCNFYVRVFLYILVYKHVYTRIFNKMVLWVFSSEILAKHADMTPAETCHAHHSPRNHSQQSSPSFLPPKQKSPVILGIH